MSNTPDTTVVPFALEAAVLAALLAQKVVTRPVIEINPTQTHVAVYQQTWYSEQTVHSISHEVRSYVQRGLVHIGTWPISDVLRGQMAPIVTA
jgi:hypothetical protein